MSRNYRSSNPATITAGVLRTRLEGVPDDAPVTLAFAGEARWVITDAEYVGYANSVQFLLQGQSDAEPYRGNE